MTVAINSTKEIVLNEQMNAALPPSPTRTHWSPARTHARTLARPQTRRVPVIQTADRKC